MKVLVACEFSGIVREAFILKGHEAWSCDIEPTEIKSKYHIQDDIRNVERSGWDMLIGFPPCTHLAVSGARWFKDKEEEQKQGIEFAQYLFDWPCDKIAIENPISILSTVIRKPDQIIQPWMFGHSYVKSTCLWLKGLPKLHPTRIAHARYDVCHREGPSSYRSKNRSRTFPGIAKAMTEQWGEN